MLCSFEQRRPAAGILRLISTQNFILVLKIKAQLSEVGNKILRLSDEAQKIQGARVNLRTSHVEQSLTPNSQTRSAPSETRKYG